MAIQFHPCDPAFVASIRGGGPDAYGQLAERAVSDSDDVPCRSCLRHVAADAEQLFQNAEVAYVEVRSALNTCFQTRITKAT